MGKSLIHFHYVGLGSEAAFSGLGGFIQGKEMASRVLHSRNE